MHVQNLSSKKATYAENHMRVTDSECMFKYIDIYMYVAMFVIPNTATNQLSHKHTELCYCSETFNIHKHNTIIYFLISG